MSLGAAFIASSVPSIRPPTPFRQTSFVSPLSVTTPTVQAPHPQSINHHGMALTPQAGLLHNLFTKPRVRRFGSIPVVHIPGLSARPPLPSWLLIVLLAAVVYVIRRFIVLRHLARPYQRADLKGDIAAFYDARSAAWETVWGEHMHHGLYDPIGPNGQVITGVEAQVRTMSELLHLADDIPKGARIVDVGCGIGGASRFLARELDTAQITGITLSPVQAARANELNRVLGLDSRVNIEVRDALNTGFPDNHFDVVWSLESGEHMENKQIFLEECTRILKPEGKLVMVAWCIRESVPPLNVAERFSIRRIMEEYCLPRVVPGSEYSNEMIRAGLRSVQSSDWTTRAAPFWDEVWRSAIFSLKGWTVLFKYGWPLIRSALAMRFVMSGIRLGAFRLVSFAGRKPTPAQMKVEKEMEDSVQRCSTTTLS